jgi:biotin operon repressor
LYHLLVIDDFPDVKNECESAPILLKRLGSMGRELRIRLLALTQSNRVKTLGIEGEGDARDNFTILRLGSFAVDVLPAAREMQRPAVLEWRGEQHPIDTLGLYGSHSQRISEDRWWTMPEPTNDEVLADLLGQTQSQPAPQRKDRIRALFEQDPAQELSAKDVAEMLGLSRAASVREHLRALVAEGVLMSVQELRSGQPTEVYTMADRQTD